MIFQIFFRTFSSFVRPFPCGVPSCSNHLSLWCSLCSYRFLGLLIHFFCGGLSLGVEPSCSISTLVYLSCPCDSHILTHAYIYLKMWRYSFFCFAGQDFCLFFNYLVPIIRSFGHILMRSCHKYFWYLRCFLFCSVHILYFL